MSYTIEYDRQFIRSNLGITPCWLAGSNNCTEFYNGRERRERSWYVFMNQLGATEESIIAAIAPSFGGYGEHWMRNGKWMGDAEVLRWIKNGCASAEPIEKVLEANHLRSVPCYVSVWRDDKHDYMHRRSISTTEELDMWIKDVSEDADAKGGCRIIEFGYNKITHPRKEKLSRPDKVVLKRGRGSKASYLTNHTPNGSSWNESIHKAVVLSYDEAEALVKNANSDTWIRSATIIDASAMDYPYNAVLRFESGKRAGLYVRKKARNCLYLTPHRDEAYRYRDKSAAAKALKRIQPGFAASCGTLAVELI